MKISIQINEDFSSPTELTMFAAKLQAMLALPNAQFEALYKALAGTASNTNPVAAPPAPVAAAVPAERAPVVVTQTATVEPAAAPLSEPYSPTYPAEEHAKREAAAIAAELDAASPAPADLAPKGKRGRPSSKNSPAAAAVAAPDEALPGVASAPKASTGGAAGVTADVAKHPIAAAIDAGKNDADALAAFQSRITSQYLPGALSEFMAVLKDYKIKAARELPADKRDEFFAKLDAAIAMKAAA